MNEQPPIGSNPGDEQRFRVAYLVAGFIRQSLTEAEHLELDEWVTASMDNQRLFERMIDEKNIDAGLKQLQSIDAKAALKKLKAKIDNPVRQKASVRSLWAYVAAAMVIVLVMIGFLMIGNKKEHIVKPDLITQSSDIPPGTNLATLTTADGSVIRLDSVKIGALNLHSNEVITKLDSGQLAYEANPSLVSHVDLYNTLTVPAGGQYKLVLPDGSRVWLNAASSLKYTIAFAGNKRTVELSGEGYFEITKDPAHPFEVRAGGSLVQVLGTHFNINAYANEPQVRVVLAEGSVKLNNTTILKPGEEGSVDGSGSVKTTQADVESTLAWTKGQFIFKQAPLDAVMRQVERWYNCEVIFDANITDHFNASASRNVPVSKLLHFLEGTGTVHFRITDRRITVMK